MKEFPILFSAPMIQSLLDGHKTMTRRIVKGIDHDLLDMMCEDVETETPNSELLDLLYGPSTDDDGKRIDEQWLVRCTECPEEGVLTMGQGYGQVGDALVVEGTEIKLEITDVRLEKIRDITLGEICKEGLAGSIYEFAPVQAGFKFFAALWDEIYGSGSWDENPWVWVIEFKRVDSEGYY
jgi:hypothetical protein